MLPQFSHSQVQEDSITPGMVSQLDLIPNTVFKILKKRHWLDWIEYLGLAGSLGGAIAVLMSAHPSYAITPLTVTLSLSAANRYRSEQQIQRHQALELAEVQQAMERLEKGAVTVLVKWRQQVSQDLELIRQEIRGLSPAESLNMQGMEEQVTAIQESVALLQEGLTAAIVEVRQQISQHLEALSLPEASDLTQINETLHELQRTTYRLETTALKAEDLEAVNVRFVVIEQALMGLQSDLSTLAHHPETPELSEIQSQLEHLEQQNQELIKPYLKRLSIAVKQLQQTDVTLLKNLGNRERKIS